MARKRKAIDDSPVHNGSAPRADNAKDSVAKKRRVDWSTVDDFPGFTVSSVNLKAQKKQTIVAAKKLKNGVERKSPKYPGQDAPLDAYVVQPNPFPEADLSEIHVKISPAFYWESTNRYRKFTINGEEFQVGQVVFVKNSDAPEDKNSPDSLEGWLAKVLEVRAGDSSHVYLRVFWVYRPEDLPCGRQPHHGANEVIVSNHMDIIEALTVQSSAEMVYWNDDPDSLPLPADRVFFRQSFDVTKKGNPLSKLNKNCIDNQPINPDELLVQCSHCSEWLPARSLEQQAIRSITSDHITSNHKSSTSPPKKRGLPNKRTKSNGDDSAIQSSFDANLTVSIDGKTRLTITDNHISEENKESRQWDVDIICLKCGKGIEKDEDGLPSVERKDSTIHVSSDADRDNGYENGTTTLVIRDGDKTLIKDDGADSVIDNQDQGQDAEMKSAPPNEALSTKLESAPTEITEMTETKAPKKRGCPPGSTKRKRASTGSATSLAAESSLPRAKHAKLLNPIKEENTEKENIVSTITATQDWLTNAAQTAASASDLTKADAKLTTTPPQALTSESVFQSGVRSVKRLLWNS